MSKDPGNELEVQPSVDGLKTPEPQLSMPEPTIEVSAQPTAAQQPVASFDDLGALQHAQPNFGQLHANSAAYAAMGSLHAPRGFQQYQHYGMYHGMQYPGHGYHPQHGHYPPPHAMHYQYPHHMNSMHFKPVNPFPEHGPSTQQGPKIIDDFVDWLAKKLEQLIKGKKNAKGPAGGGGAKANPRPQRPTNRQISQQRMAQIKGK